MGHDAPISYIDDFRTITSLQSTTRHLIEVDGKQGRIPPHFIVGRRCAWLTVTVRKYASDLARLLAGERVPMPCRRR